MRLYSILYDFFIVVYNMKKKIFKALNFSSNYENEDLTTIDSKRSDLF